MQKKTKYLIYTVLSLLLVIIIIFESQKAKSHVRPILQKETAGGFCWVDNVTVINNEVHVSMRPQYIWAIRSITSSNGTNIDINKRKKGNTFILQENESAYLSTLPEDACTAKAMKVKNVLGLELKSSLCMPNPQIKCQNEAVFVSTSM